MKKIVFTFGIIAGVIVSGMLFITFSGDIERMDQGELAGYITMIIALSVIFFAIKTYRDKYNNGMITFGKAFLMGLYITLVASTLYVASWMVISGTIATDFMEQYHAQAIQELMASDKPQEEINKEIQQMEAFKEMYKNPVIKAAVTYLEILPIGLLISLISAGILRRKRNR